MERPCSCGGRNAHCWRCNGSGYLVQHDSQAVFAAQTAREAAKLANYTDARARTFSVGGVIYEEVRVVSTGREKF